MLFQRVNRSDPEKIFVVAYNSYSTASLTNGQCVQWDLTDHDGVSVTRPSARATSAGFLAAGVAAETIAAGSYGLIQVYGYHSAVRARTMTAGTVALAAGCPLALNAAGSVFCAESYDTGSNQLLVYPFAVNLSGASTLWTTTTVAAFIKAL